MIGRLWEQVGGTLIEQPGFAKGIDALILVQEEKRRLGPDQPDGMHQGQEILVVQTEPGRLNLDLMGRAVFGAALLKKCRPRSVRCLALCAEDDPDTNNGTLNLSANGGNTITSGCTNSGTINQPGGNNSIFNLDNKGSIFLNGGELTLGGTFGKQTGARATTTFNGGTLRLNLGGNAFLLQAGNLVGSPNGSTIFGSVTNSGGVIYAGGTTGTLELWGGAYTQQGTEAKLVIGVDVNGGTTSKLKASAGNLGGKLEVNWTNGTPGAGSEWAIINFITLMPPALTGDFDQFTSSGTANPTYTHMAGTVNPYKIKVN